jgi:hypothetical protein
VPLLWAVLPVLAGCPTVDVGDPPVAPGTCQPDRVVFESTIYPMAIAPADATKSCVGMSGCHARDTGRSALRLIDPPVTPGDWDSNYEVVTRFLNCGTPEASPFITKPQSGGDPHAGGDLWDRGGEPALTVEQWISGG